MSNHHPSHLVPTARRFRPASRALRWGVVGGVVFTLVACVQAPPRRAMAPPMPAPVESAMYFYPSQGQSEARQDRDRFECYQWAKMQTGTDPGMTPVRRMAPQPYEPRVTGAGAAVGAVTGAAIGAATSGRHHSGQAMVMGAIIGTLLGAATENANVQAQARAEDARSQRSRANAANQIIPFQRAMGACMSSRGYSVG